MLVLHEFEIAGHEVEAVEVRFTDDVSQRPPLVVVANCAIEGVAPAQIEFGLDAEHRTERRLWIQIDSEHAITLKREPLRKVKCCRGLRRSTFEVDASECLEPFAVASSWQQYT